ncbi:hypothetical protein MXD61_09885 [Frankia sp. AgPm24]|uniref:hypothetical protein n=1 Tax=Frankia sp. AgPm24 TaxID=631128 RepID=UPI00200EA396|nr:hypothetical protein [Frankia sp. AgPm24]MCK9922185.1 hypothetical protein [Frankia sp. AgPm24]
MSVLEVFVLCVFAGGASADPFGSTLCADTDRGCSVWAGTTGQAAVPHAAPLAGAAVSSATAELPSCPSSGSNVLACLATRQGWSGGDGCRYRAATDFEAAPDIAAEEVKPGVAGSWYWKSCQDGATFDVVWLPDAEAAPSPAAVAQLAVKKLVMPTPQLAMSPGLGVPQLVGVPVWLWLAGAWGPVSATAAVPGVSVTATARPQEVRWNFGDGGAVECAGPGTAFRPDVDDPATASPDCGWVFSRSSAREVDGRFPVRVTVRWQVGWAGAGQQGVVPDVTSQSVVSVAVDESQALVVPAPGGAR